MDVLEDKRVFERFSAVYPLRFVGSSQAYGLEGRFGDASAGGACVVTRRHFDVGDLIAVDVCFSDKNLSALFIGKVIWSRKSDFSLWKFGFEFHKNDFLKISALYSDKIAL